MYIKLEKISVPGKVFITRNNVRQKAQPNMVITEQELASLEVLNGEVVYSVDELTLHTIKAKEPEPKPIPFSEEPVVTKVVKSTKTK